MADQTQSDRIEAKIATVELEQRQQTALLTALTDGIQLMAITLASLAAQLDAATTAEATALAAQTTQIDAVQTEIQSLFDRLQAAGVSQGILDSLQGSVARLGGTSTALVAQSARLTAMAVDPANPVPTPPPAG